MASFAGLTFIFRFLPVFLIIYYAVPSKYKDMVLLLGSYVFYAVGDPYFIALLFLLTWLNYYVGKKMKDLSEGFEIHDWQKIKQKRILIAIVAMDVAVLVLFKGLAAFAGSALLPLGISFYIFKMISYQVDLYRGEIWGKPGCKEAALYFALFPQVASGPIMR